MTLIKSISGIRGTIGGLTKENLTPLDVVRFTTAYAQLLKEKNKSTLTVVTGRDARISGPMIHSLVNQTLVGMGVNVINLELSTTPTVAVAVTMEKAVASAVNSSLMIVLGSSLVVQPVAGLPKIALENGNRLIICNLQTTPYDQHADVVLYEKIESIAEELLLSRVLN